MNFEDISVDISSKLSNSKLDGCYFSGRMTNNAVFTCNGVIVVRRFRYDYCGFAVGGRE